MPNFRVWGVRPDNPRNAPSSCKGPHEEVQMAASGSRAVGWSLLSAERR
jgi:hypothetical protein